MTYDQWKLETPEDEAQRLARYRPRLGHQQECPSCGEHSPASRTQCECGEPLDGEEAFEPDPDDARDARRDEPEFYR